MESKEFNEFVRDIKSKNKDITINFEEDLNKMISGMENTELQLALESFKDVLYEIRMTIFKSFIAYNLSPSRFFMTTYVRLSLLCS